MIVWTFQNKAVIEKIMESGEHFMTWEDFYKHSSYAKRFKEPYQKIMDYFNMNTLPIWTYLTYYGESITDEKVEEFIKSSCHSGNPNDVLLKINVPDHLAHKTSYYDWSDYLYFTIDEPDEKEANLSWECAVNVGEDRDTIQVLLPFIKKEWIECVYETSKQAMLV